MKVTMADLQTRLDAARRIAAAKMAVYAPDVYCQLVNAGGLRGLATECDPRRQAIREYGAKVLDDRLAPRGDLQDPAVAGAAEDAMAVWRWQDLSLTPHDRARYAARLAPYAHPTEFVRG